MTDKEVRFFQRQKKLIDSFYVDESQARRKLKEELEITEAKYGTNPREFN